MAILVAIFAFLLIRVSGPLIDKLKLAVLQRGELYIMFSLLHLGRLHTSMQEKWPWRVVAGMTFLNTFALRKDFDEHRYGLSSGELDELLQLCRESKELMISCSALLVLLIFSLKVEFCWGFRFSGGATLYFVVSTMTSKTEDVAWRSWRDGTHTTKTSTRNLYCNNLV